MIFDKNIAKGELNFQLGVHHLLSGGPGGRARWQRLLLPHHQEKCPATEVMVLSMSKE